MEIFCKAEKNEYIDFNEPILIQNCFYAKSLDQHDAEVRAEERKKVCERLEMWIESHCITGCIIDYKDLQQKLTELKGE